MNDITDRQLFLEFVKGNNAAFDQLYGRYHKDVLQVVRRYVPSHLMSEVSDICQHFWCGLLQYAHTYDASRPVRNWLISAAVKAVASYVKRHTPRPALHKKTFSLDAETDPLYTRMRGPVPKAILKEEFAVAKAALDRIPERYRRVVSAVYLDGDTPTEYARANNIPVMVAFGRLRRGLAKLREFGAVKQLRSVHVSHMIKTSLLGLREGCQGTMPIGRADRITEDGAPYGEQPYTQSRSS